MGAVLIVLLSLNVAVFSVASVIGAGVAMRRLRRGPVNVTPLLPAAWVVRRTK